MSGIAVCHERSGTPVEPGALDLAMTRLAHRGPDGSDTQTVGHVALGHQHFWTTPEELGEQQPLGLAGTPLRIVFDGRLDNRHEIVAELALDREDGSRISDAALALRAYDRWGDACFSHLVGEYAFVLFDSRSGDLVCARDPLGDRTLFYSQHGSRTVITSEPWAATSVDSPGFTLDEDAATHYFGLETPADGKTLFAGVRELLPGQVLVVGDSGERSWRHWQPDPTRRLRGASDEEYASQFRSLLEESVRCRLRSTTPAAVLMSGGLDSTSVACLAASLQPTVPLTTVSYVFDELEDCDERRYITEVEKRWRIRSLQIPCDGLWPLKGWRDWPRNLNQPEGNPYRLLKEHAYRRTHEQGLRVLLSGAFGDELYGRGPEWLTELVEEGRVREAGRELWRHIRKLGLRRTLGTNFFRRFGRRALGLVPGGAVVRRGWSPPAWLTADAADRLRRAVVARADGQTPDDELVGTNAAMNSSAEIPNASRHAVDLRNPYRDRRLVEFVLSLPAHQLYNRGRYKHVLRNAMRGALPEPIRTRIQTTPLIPLFNRGVEREEPVFRACLEDPAAVWRRFVSAEWLAERWRPLESPDQDGPEALVAWMCISFEAWYSTTLPGGRVDWS